MSQPAYQIRAATPGDCEAITRLFAGPKAIHGTLQLPYPSPETWRKRLSEPEPGLVALVACHEAELGMTVRDDWQDKGAGTALLRAALDLADNWIGLTRIELTVFTDNEPGLKLYKKFGFEIEGTQRQYGFRNGELVDAFLMARLRPVRLQ